MVDRVKYRAKFIEFSQANEMAALLACLSVS
jgi:hypothetical protein